MYQQGVAKVRQWSLLAALAALLVGATAANAAVYRGTWDPVFNASFSAATGISDVGWKGTTTVTVDDGCLVANTTPFVPSGSCLSATLDAATLTFYNTTTNVDIGTIAWVSPLTTITQLSIDASSDLNGIDLSLPLTATTALFAPTSYDVTLDFSLTGASLTMVGACPIVTSFRLRLSAPALCTYNSETTPPLTWTRVPEPASLALVGIALTALGLSRRRIQRRKQA